jgi:hypothetical protein
MTKEKLICILPTGDWAEINNENQALFYAVNQATFEALCNGDIQASDVELIMNGISSLEDCTGEKTL